MKNEKFLLDIQTKCGNITNKILKRQLMLNELSNASDLMFYQEKPKRKNKMNLLIHAVLNIMMHSQTLPNIQEIFQNIYHIDLLYILPNSIGNSFCTPCTSLVFQLALGNVLYHHNRNPMGNFKFLDGLRMVCLPLNISEKLH